MVRKGKFIIGNSKSSKLSLEQQILIYNRQLTKLNTKVDLISAWITKKFGVLFLVEACSRVKNVSKHLPLIKSTAQRSANAAVKKAKPKLQTVSGHSGSDVLAESDVMVVADSDFDEADKDAEIATMVSEDDLASLEGGDPEMEGRISQQRKSKVQRHKMARFRVGANNGQEIKGTQEQQRTHTGVKPFKCTWPNCVKSFRSSWHLTTHRRIHTGEKPYACDWPNCDKSFNRSDTLKAHGRTHTGEKSFACDWPNCNKSYTASCTLKVHRRIHTGERPFDCGFCGHRWATGSELASHMRIHTGEKPYKCRVCPATFTHSTQKVRHEKLHH